MPDGYFGSLPIPYNVKADPNSLAEEIAQLDSEKADKTTTINGKSLEADRTLYVQDIPSKNLLPNNASTTTVNGVTFTINADGSISTSGTASSGIQFTIGSLTLKSGIQYAFTGCPSGGDLGSYFINFSGVVNDTGNGATATPASDVTTNAVINIVSGTNMNGKTFRPMIRLASIDDDSYVPYAKTNVELSKDLIDISSSFVWNTSVTFSTKTIVAFYDPVRRLVMGNMAYDASAAISSSTFHIQIASAYRPKSNVAQPCMYYHSSDNAWKVASLTFGANGNITQGTTNYWKSTLCSFMYSV